MAHIGKVSLARAAYCLSPIPAPKFSPLAIAARKMMLSNRLPSCIQITAALKFTLPLSNNDSAFFSHWQANNASPSSIKDAISARFSQGLDTQSVQGISPAQFEKLHDKEVIANISAICESFFPIDPPDVKALETFVNSEFVTSFKQSEQAKAFQKAAFLKIAASLGIIQHQDRLCLKKDFLAKDCILLSTPNGRSALAQLIRSLHLLGNQEIAAQFQLLLLAIGRRYHILDEKMTDIALASAPDYWHDRDLPKTDSSTLINNLLWQEPTKPLIKLPQEGINSTFLAPTANSIADFFLGHSTNKQGHFLRSIVQSLDIKHFINSDLKLFNQLFPIEIQGALFNHKTDTQRCFRQNPLLRYSHRKIAAIVLKAFHLKNDSEKNILVDETVAIQELSWLQQDNFTQRQALLTMIKSLYQLENHAFAENLKDCVLSLLERHYHGADIFSVLSEFEAVIPCEKKRASATVLTSPLPLTHQSPPASPLPSPEPEINVELDTDIDSQESQLTQAIQGYFKEKDADVLLAELNKLSPSKISDEKLSIALGQKDDEGTPLIIKAINSNHKRLSQALLNTIGLIKNAKDIKSLLLTKDKKGDHALFTACDINDVDSLKSLLYLMRDVDEEAKVELLTLKMSEYKQPLLCFTSINRFDECSQALLEFIKPFSQENLYQVLMATSQKGNSALKNAAESENFTLFSALLEIIGTLKEQQQIAVLDAKNNYDLNALAAAAKKGHNKPISLFLTAIKDFNLDTKLGLIDSPNKDTGCSPICTAAFQGHSKAVSVLLNELNNLDLTTKDELLTTKEPKGYQALLFAIKQANIGCFDIMLTALDNLTHKQHEPFLTMVDKSGANALICAAKSGNDKMMRKVLEMLEPLSTEKIFELLKAKDENQRSALSHAAEKGNKQAIDALLTAIISIINVLHKDTLDKLKQNVNRGSIFKRSSRSGEHQSYIAMVQKELFDLFSSPNQEGHPPLMLAKQAGHDDCVELLSNTFNSAYLSKAQKKLLLIPSTPIAKI